MINQLFNYIACAALALLYTLGATEISHAADSSEQPFNTIEWVDLIPQHVLEILMNPPSYLSEIEDGSAEDQISSQIKSSIAAASDDAYQQALVSTEVNTDMNGAKVRIPGFIVPLEFDEQQTVTQFFLVPYFGACLHMPPPPPNQIILVDSSQGIQLEELYVPFWISGEMRTTLVENDMATAAYSLEMAAYEVYTE
jgi:hypothetical protein